MHRASLKDIPTLVQVTSEHLIAIPLRSRDNCWLPQWALHRARTATCAKDNLDRRSSTKYVTTLRFEEMKPVFHVTV